MKILNIILFLNLYYCSNSNNVVYHLYSPTESCPVVLDWNIELNEKTEYYIKEKIDSMNRVVEIQFYQNENIFDVWPYAVPIVRYKYIDNQIFEFCYDAKGYILSYNDSESPFCSIYSLNANNEIIECEFVFYIGTDKITDIDFNNSSIIRKSASNIDYITYYLYSSSKMNKVFPKAKNYTFDKGILEQVYDEKLLKEFSY